MYTRVIVKCTRCGYEDRGEHLWQFVKKIGSEGEPEALVLISCPGKLSGGEDCGQLLKPRRVRARYPVMFHKGEIRTVHLPPETLALPPVEEYPVRMLHKEQVEVLREGPDDEGLVDIKLPKPYIYRQGRQVHTIRQLPVLYSILSMS